jgi:hypothetical protein
LGILFRVVDSVSHVENGGRATVFILGEADSMILSELRRMAVVYARHARRDRRTSATRARFMPHGNRSGIHGMYSKPSLGARLSVQVSFDVGKTPQCNPASRARGNDSYWLFKHFEADPIPAAPLRLSGVPAMRFPAAPSCLPGRHDIKSQAVPRLRPCAIHVSRRLCLVITHAPCIAAYTTYERPQIG